jgi:hypothetical protein
MKEGRTLQRLAYIITHYVVNMLQEVYFVLTYYDSFEVWKDF